MRINLAYAENVFGNLTGLSPNDIKPELNFGRDTPDLNKRVEQIIKTYVAPYVLAWDGHSTTCVKYAIQYLLTFDSDLAMRYFMGHLPTFPPSDPPRMMFEWLWKELFPAESWALEGSASDYEVVNQHDKVRIEFDPNVAIPSAFIGEKYRQFAASKP